MRVKAPRLQEVQQLRSEVDEMDRRLHEGFLWLACSGLNRQTFHWTTVGSSSLWFDLEFEVQHMTKRRCPSSDPAIYGVVTV